MVDAVVSYVVERLGEFLIQEAVFLGGVRNEVKWLKNELGWMKSYITNAEDQQVDNPIARKWLSDITEIAYDIEDVIDRFTLKVYHGANIDQETNETRTGCLSSRCCCILDKKSNLFIHCKEMVNVCKLRKEIEDIKRRINDLSRKRELYGILQNSRDRSALGRLKQLRRSTSYAVEGKVVGFEDDATTLLAKLSENDPHRFVISIFGMGGLGKTTLARKLYHNHDVKMKFRYCAWVSVSQDYNVRDLLIRIIKSFGIATINIMEKLKHKSEEDLGRVLFENLRGHAYLLVIDDIWQKEAWESLKRALPDCNNGSRVIITTRIKEVAQCSDERSHLHVLRFLRLDESWQLFCQKTFGNLDANGAEAEFTTLGMEMVQKCNGLPLAIVVLGGLLSTKTKLEEWKEVREHIWQHLSNDSIHIFHLLALSFNDLSYELKLCFLYTSRFPEDFEINVEKLMRLWIAEGFVAQDENRRIEDVAKNNFGELINRSLIHIGTIRWGRVVSCRIHDLLRDLAIRKAKELKFLHIYDEIKHSMHDSFVMTSWRREAIYLGAEKCLWLEQSNPNLRSLVFFNPYMSLRDMTQQLKHICFKFRFLRVLDLNCQNVTRINSQNLGEEIGKLIHLKYLGLGGARINKLPRSIINLRRLQTIDLFSGNMEVELPNEISELQELEHLMGIFVGRLQIDGLTKLQSLKYVKTEIWNQISTENLANLRDLWIYERLPRETKEFQFDSIAKIKRLQQLSVKLWHGSSFTLLQPLSHCSCLITLRLYGKMKNIPEDIHAVLPNLECLLLKDSCLDHDPMPVLERLPHQTILNLGIGVYCGKKLVCMAQGFPQLELLKLDEDGEVEEWHVEDGAMPKLKGLSIPKESKMRIPQRLKSIPPPGEHEFEQGWFDCRL